RLRPGAYALLLGTDGRVLLTEQTTPDFTEVQLPGGGIDPGESPVPALTREVLEETGYRCRIRRRLGAFRHFTYMVEYGFFAEKLCHVYLGQVGTRLSDPREAGHRALWVAQHAAADLIESEGASAFAYAALSRGV
ncbi:MAG: NUDIX domain-containing protein, partial [Pseudomonadota bacterium]